jgi:hypothetical protein
MTLKKSIEDIDGTPYISDTFSISKINHITNSVETDITFTLMK